MGSASPLHSLATRVRNAPFVGADTNPRFHRLLEAFEALTGCGVVINTSFNVRDEPIVCTPEDAFRCFMATDMDVLVLENHVLFKAEQPDGLIEDAEMVKFAKNGSDTTTAAVRLARAHTGRDRIALCSDHPFFAIDDWFIGTTPMRAGVPKAVREQTLTFRYNDLDSVRALFFVDIADIT